MQNGNYFLFSQSSQNEQKHPKRKTMPDQQIGRDTPKFRANVRQPAKAGFITKILLTPPPKKKRGEFERIFLLSVRYFAESNQKLF